MRLVARCPAKVNLALRVLGKRSDGYHELETVFQAVDLWDLLDVEPADDLEMACDQEGIPLDESNLVLRAAHRFREATGVDRGASFRLRKGIPVGGGMGGGSSDAAGALLLLDRLWGTRARPEQLHAIAAGLGADVAFFLTGGTALGRGRGERIEPLESLEETPLLLGLPPFGIPTAEVYRRVRAPTGPGREAVRLTPPGNDVSVARFSTLKLPGGKDFGFVTNDLERVVFEGWPELQAFRDSLIEAGARRALVSGSGSTVFGIFPESGLVERAISILGCAFAAWELRPCRTIGGGIRVRSEAG
jgi:4-diphosphocytidyl-2-C-methyl-D-erythritol kinase